ncbi:PEP-CTERM sorting domain-containing protein [Roseisolibacter sp. H3M3-2]|uniref:PEP-CTERM sorting domain-containing protein n=1 Tax=Roseisolibacter sp. H3M3-2 TaxID=3031323 RepID=UPI0023DB6C55|nr:PEP-CTERM sorting domain-containing protein [Roseisolibacter sp. H3M3-2]MDF1501741.1 PEP-CTERM sorting domain-containing protein [Roseisolibacter sp. H3M3-2]
MRTLRRALALLALAPLAASAQLVRSGAGDLAAVTAARDQFRLDLGGGTVAGANGAFGGVRREINWDGVPDAAAAPNSLPANFFNTNSPRGVVLSTPGTGFQVSANAGVAPIEFDNLDPSYSATFQPFSAQRLFTALGSNVVDVEFLAPGTATPALTRGFGAVFSDVDLANLTSIQFFDAALNSLGTFFVPNVVGANPSFSFLGVSFAEAAVRRVRITSGTAALGAGVTENLALQRDLVVMDDFLYGEPGAAAVVPEPATVALTATGLLLLAGAARRRRA